MCVDFDGVVGVVVDGFVEIWWYFDGGVEFFL